ncbi:UDP-2,4-diacetamido-2,4,6-trideoxy-beta-L-altropyranose hydrolase [Pseudomonas sp. FW215-R2]|uniref:UDP-2,4-diacetamido-2,4, 6-trideoxy-beta-L-altropyranose hydrolase n=1 Tax=unclassified Pseudomonas TaxID=196821 RepID=UPI000C888FA3|nr:MULTISPECIES: UDP-2,4-diacetamido-2,4,6-trideoxy-beta-L-altropyranose hydrolase [unclassified Pseudomonas]PMX02435.1 UDP-2,4-diacetamido-2,4,6-trideoxy-beta-L-altropyranose hydrolase [Pseudomonas sp. FW215-R2]PMX11120.1 UDP-2,4-diacetamido-2,4,6-trideoxy-beta-L-altropyranose hydrolase [Pseudomonas sp. FW215-L1]PMX23165.1 UDP-2,4-diacetamido-2,4,6-trideoxy-beta-L-altropyranose hydrolase [Pseudomonas sp. FW215-E1]PNA30005.1 UDP-2,4-diacetamido-2,4,6-trideoxy-beta-L-altropyranose hydrolase [Pse
MRVLIRADASPTIGSGHIARCLTLARVLRAQGSHVAFACRRLPGHRLDALQGEGFETFALPDRYTDEDPEQAIESMLPWRADIDALATQLEGQAEFDWVIADHYGLDHHWQTAARRFAPRIAAVDDLATRRYSVDLLLNQNLSGLSENYQPLLPAGCRTLLGPRFAMLREEFSGPVIEIKPVARRVLVNFGGFDAARQTHHAMLALADFSGLEVDFVAGADNPAWAQMQALAASRPNWRLHSFVSDFHRRMTEADLFIGAGGGTSWERAAMGLPTICIAVSNNQQANGEVMAAAGAHVFMGAREQVSVEQLRDAVGFVVGNFYLRQSLAERSRQLVDGRGALRVAAALAGAVLTLRGATLDDAQVLFDGRNADAVQRWSVKSGAIEWSQHLNWLSASLRNPQRLLLIAEADDGPVGVLRYDLRGFEAEVSLYLLEGRFGLGWGRALLTRGEAIVTAHWPQLTAISAQVLPANRASLNVFRDAGFTQSACAFTKDLKEHRS